MLRHIVNVTYLLAPGFLLITGCGGGKKTGEEEQDTLPRDYDDMYRAEIDAFFDAVDGTAAPAVTAYEAMEVMEMAFALVTSYEVSLGREGE